MSWRAEKPQPIDADTAVAYADDKGWDAEWANMTPEEIVADMRRYVGPETLADEFVQNEPLYRLWALRRLQRISEDARHD